MTIRRRINRLAADFGIKSGPMTKCTRCEGTGTEPDLGQVFTGVLSKLRSMGDDPRPPLPLPDRSPPGLCTGCNGRGVRPVGDAEHLAELGAAHLLETYHRYRDDFERWGEPTK